MRHLYVTGEGVILGVAENQPGSRVHVAWDTKTALRWHAELREGTPEDVGVAISDEGLEILIGSARPGSDGEMEAIFEADADEDEDTPIYYRLGPKGRHFVACSHPITGFREFLNSWRFLDQDTGVVRNLGQNLWPGQELAAAKAQFNAMIYYLKARQLGETTLAIGYDGWVMRFRTPNCRVHLVSRTETLSRTSLMKPLKFGLRNLPREMLLPEAQDTATIFQLDAGPDDRRLAQSYSAKEPGRGETCSHLHLDEWAAMAETSPELPKDVWAAAEPTISKHGGTCHILTTGAGPVGYYADVWRACIASRGQLTACFIKASGSRPEYTAEYLHAKRLSLADDEKFRHEYPETWEDALAGAGDTFFTSESIKLANEYARGFQPGPGVYVDAKGRERKRKYIKAWDIAGPGDQSDAVVGLVIDVTENVWDVVDMVYSQGEAYPTTALRIEHLHAKWPGLTAIESNEAGAAVASFLNIPEEQLILHRTTRQSKPVCLSEVRFALQAQEIKWNPEDAPELDAEMRSYKLDDAYIKQDTVMALSIGVHYGAQAAAADGDGRILSVVRV